MKRTQIQFPDPLYQTARLKQVAEIIDWPLAEVVRRATELYVQRFLEMEVSETEWVFPLVDMGGDFIVDPALVSADVCSGLRVKVPSRPASDLVELVSG